jgi:hypothetical protein
VKRTALVIGALGALALLPACGSDYGYRQAGYGGPDVWYDGAYGPYSNGYWRGDGYYYRGGDGRFQRDDGGHFRHQRFDGSNGYRSGHDDRDGDRRGDRDGDRR